MKVAKSLRIWAAGFFDGEGCVGTTKPRPGPRNREISRVIRVSVGNTHRGSLELLLGVFGGTIAKGITYPNRRQMFYWKVSSKKAEVFLLSIRPWSIVKRPQIDVALAMRRLINRRHAGRVAKIVVLSNRLMDLNGRHHMKKAG